MGGMMSPGVSGMRSPVMRPGVGATDQQREWDRASLAATLQNMTMAVMKAEENIATRDGDGMAALDGTGGPLGDDEYADGGEAGDYGGGGGSGGGGYGARGSFAAPVGYDEDGNPVIPEPDVREDEMPEVAITGGWIHKKGGKAGLFSSGRSWHAYYVRLLDKTWLCGFDKVDSDKPVFQFGIDADTVVTPGDPSRTHRNKKVKNDWVVENAAGEMLELYADAEEDANAWMETIGYVARKCQEAVMTANEAVVTAAAATGGGAGGNRRRGRGSGGMDGDDVGAGFDGRPLGGSGRAGGGGLLSPPGPSAEEREALADAAQCHTAFGPGLYEAVRGEQAHFVIEARDASGTVVGFGGDTDFTVALVNDELLIDITPADNGDGTYTCEYTPSRVGEYELRVCWRDHHIYGSPFAVSVARAPTAPSHCTAVGEGTTLARTDAVNTLIITARDQFHEPRGVGGDNFQVTIIGPATVQPIEDCGDGTYVLRYVIDREHRAYRAAAAAATSAAASSTLLPQLEIVVTLQNGFAYDRPIAGSPFRPRIIVPELEAAISARTGIRSPALSSYEGGGGVPLLTDAPTTLAGRGSAPGVGRAAPTRPEVCPFSRRATPRHTAPRCHPPPPFPPPAARYIGAGRCGGGEAARGTGSQGPRHGGATGCGGGHAGAVGE